MWVHNSALPALLCWSLQIIVNSTPFCIHENNDPPPLFFQPTPTCTLWLVSKCKRHTFLNRENFWIKTNQSKWKFLGGPGWSRHTVIFYPRLQNSRVFFSKSVKKSVKRGVFLASLPSLALCFQPRSRPFVWLLARTWIRKKKYGLFCSKIFPFFYKLKWIRIKFLLFLFPEDLEEGIFSLMMYYNFEMKNESPTTVHWAAKGKTLWVFVAAIFGSNNAIECFHMTSRRPYCWFSVSRHSK